MPVQGDPNWICTTVRDRVLPMLQADSEAASYSWASLTGLDYDPIDISQLTNRLPVYTVAFSYPRPGVFDGFAQNAMENDFLTLKYFHRIMTNDIGGAVAERAVRRAIWLVGRFLTTNSSLWNTVATSTPHEKHIEEIPYEIAKTTGVVARWGWIVFQISSRVQPLNL